MKKSVRFVRIRGRIVPIYQKAQNAVTKVSRKTLVTSAAVIAAGLSAKTAIELIKNKKEK